MRDNNFQIRFAFTNIEAHRAVIEDGFFYKEDAPIPSAAFQQVLRTLIDKIPTQMRKDNQVGFGSSGVWSVVISVHEFPLLQSSGSILSLSEISSGNRSYLVPRRRRMQPESRNLKCDSARCVSATIRPGACSSIKMS